MNNISTITRNGVFEILYKGYDVECFFEKQHYEYNFLGKLSTVEFLNKIYDLKKLPSVDERFENAEEDIYCHTITNPNDYPNDWIFKDDRFPLKNGNDKDILNFLCLIFHPEIREENSCWRDILNEINRLLREDNYELYPYDQISGRDIFKWRDINAPHFYILKDSEIELFLKLFNRGGYVLNFTTSSFDDFTKKVVGIAVCRRYGLSKGKSLEQFVHDATEDHVIKLFQELLSYYESQLEYIKEIQSEASSYKFLYTKCKDIIGRVVKEKVILAPQVEKLKVIFSSGYLTSEINLMCEMQRKNPTEAIGKAKELIESCCKTILEKCHITIEKKWNIPQLVDETVRLLHITPYDISGDILGEETIKSLLGNLKVIATNISTLRNLYGSGHGKSNSYKGLEERHAKLAIGSSVTLVNFLWDSYERQKTK